MIMGTGTYNKGRGGPWVVINLATPSYVLICFLPKCRLFILGGKIVMEVVIVDMAIVEEAIVAEAVVEGGAAAPVLQIAPP